MTRDNPESNPLALVRWESTQPFTPTPKDGLATRDKQLFAAYVSQAFQKRAAEANERRMRVEKARAFIFEAYGGDSARAEEFLGRLHRLLGGQAPLAHARESEAGAAELIQLLGRAVYGGGFS